MKWSPWLMRVAAAIGAIAAPLGLVVTWIRHRREAAYLKAVREAPWSLKLSPLEGGEAGIFRATLSLNDVASNRFKILSVEIRGPRRAKLSRAVSSSEGGKWTTRAAEEGFADRIVLNAEMEHKYLPLPEAGGVLSSSSINFLARIGPTKSTLPRSTEIRLRVWLELEEISATRRVSGIEAISDPMAWPQTSAEAG